MVACAIHECELKGEKVWFTKLTEILENQDSPATILKALRVLFDWGIVKGKYGETENGRPARLLYIAGEAQDLIKEIYNKWYCKSIENQ